MNDRLTVSRDMVAALIAEQFPQWAGLVVSPVALSGWDNQTFHLGETMSVRLPSAGRYVAAVEKEHAILPPLAPHLPVPIPRPLAIGRPGQGYPFPWSICAWLPGQTASRERIGDLGEFAGDLAGFLAALRAIDATGGPLAGAHNFHRGGDLAVYDGEARASIQKLGDRIDGRAAREVWEAARASEWTHDPVWVHGDVAVGNLLVTDGLLSAVIDFGTCGVGDPACDFVIAWLVFEGESRARFRALSGADAACWARARGWGLWKAMLVALAGKTTHPDDRPALEVIAAIIAEHRDGP